jgi:hypothetical protein
MMQRVIAAASSGERAPEDADTGGWNAPTLVG